MVATQANNYGLCTPVVAWRRSSIGVQNPAPARACRFDPDLRHQHLFGPLREPLTPTREETVRATARVLGCIGIALLLLCDPSPRRWYASVLTSGWKQAMIWCGIAFVLVGVAEHCLQSCTRCRKLAWHPRHRLFANGRTEWLCTACHDAQH